MPAWAVALPQAARGSPRARDGRITYDGQDITGLPTHQIMHMGMAQAPEGRRIFARMTVHENLLMGLPLFFNCC